MKFWWATDPERLALERRVIGELDEDAVWFALSQWLFWEGRLCAQGVITAQGHQYPIRLIYPDQYPLVPAWVEPQDAVRWSTHQYGNGLLCLELRPDNWNSSATGADVLRSAFNLLEQEDPLGGTGVKAPSAHNIGEVQSYGWFRNPFMVGEGCLVRIRSGEASDVKATSWSAEELWPLLLHDETDRSSVRRPPDQDIVHWRFERTVIVSMSVAPPGELDRAALAGAGGWSPELEAWVLDTKSAVVVFVGGEQVVAFNLQDEGLTYRRSVYVLPDDQGRRSSRQSGSGEKRAVIVGGGSVGGKIAESLLRSGITKLTLVDGDVFLPANLERHVLDWDAVGFKKVTALKRRLLNIVPGAEITVIEDNLNWQRSARTHAWQVEEVAKGDVIVDATGDPATALFLAAVAEANRRAFLTAQVYEGGIGALVAVCLPDRDPPFVQGRANFQAWCETRTEPMPTSGRRRYEALADDGEPVVADDAAITMTAGHAARVILDVMDDNPPPPEEAWLLLGYRRGWVFQRHGHAIHLDVGPRSPVQPTLPDDEVWTFLNDLPVESASDPDPAD